MLLSTGEWVESTEHQRARMQTAEAYFCHPSKLVLGQVSHSNDANIVLFPDH